MMNAAHVSGPLAAAWLLLASAHIAPTFFAEEASAVRVAPATDTPQTLVNELYQLVTLKPGATPDWDQVTNLFIDEAVLVLRTSRDATTVFSVDEFVDDFKTFAERVDVKQHGFTERILKTNFTVFGDMAHAFVLYEASVGGSLRPPQQGVDSISLIRKDDRWWIAAIANEVLAADRPIPESLFATDPPE